MVDAVIICNGENVKKDLPDCFVIYADGGINHFSVLKKAPDCIIGDLDSASPNLLQRFEDKVIRVDDQNSTDSEKAIVYAKEKGFESILMTGATGSRLDHTIANLFLLEKYSELNIHLVDEHNDVFLAKPQTELKAEKGELISLIPLNDVTGLKLDGLKYNADKLSRSFVGVHNIAVKTQVRIDFDTGTLLVNRIQNQ